MATSSERSRDIPLCTKCDREFASIRGLDIHRNRSHPVSDSHVIDFLNLSAINRECVLELVSSDRGVQFDVLNTIMSGQASQAMELRLRDAMSRHTGTEYRYMISEEP